MVGEWEGGGVAGRLAGAARTEAGEPTERLSHVSVTATYASDHV